MAANAAIRKSRRMRPGRGQTGRTISTRERCQYKHASTSLPKRAKLKAEFTPQRRSARIHLRNHNKDSIVDHETSETPAWRLQAARKGKHRRDDDDSGEASSSAKKRPKVHAEKSAYFPEEESDFIEHWLEESQPLSAEIKPENLILAQSMPRHHSVPSPASLTGTTSSRKSDRSAASVHDSDYNQCLQKRNIYIEESEPPVDLMLRSQSIIQRSRESPELDDAVVQKLREKSRRLRNASEDVIIKQLGPHLIPAMNEVPDVRVEMNADQLWFNSVPVPLDADVLTTPLPLPKAKPDLAFGYSQAAFTHKQLMTIDLFVDNNFGRSYAVPDQKIRFPFLIVEFKSQAKNGTHHIATNQAAGAGAIALNGTLELMQQSHKIRKLDYNEPQFFSVTMDHELARINVHWVKAPDAGEPHSFHVEGLSKHLLDDENGIRALSRAIKNIIDHCVDRRLQDLCEALDAYRDDVLANRSAANHLQVPRGQDDDCRQSIQADVLQAKVLPSDTVRECHDHCPVKAAAIPSTPQEGGRASRRETRSMRTIGPGPANRKGQSKASSGPDKTAAELGTLGRHRRQSVAPSRMASSLTQAASSRAARPSSHRGITKK